MQVCHWIMNQIIPGSCCHLLVILAAFFASLTWSKVFNALHFASVILTALSAASSVSSPVFVILRFDYNSLFLSASLFSLPSSDSNGLSECSCDSVALRQKVAALWMWGKEKRKRLLPDCPGTKKETLFSFPTWPMRKKKCKEEVKNAGEGDGEFAGHSAKKWNCLVWKPAWRAGLKLENFLKVKSLQIKKKKTRNKKKKNKKKT